MRTIPLLLLLAAPHLALSLLAQGRDPDKREYPILVAQDAANSISAVRSDIGAKLKLKSESQSLGRKDLQELAIALDAGSNKLAQGSFESKLDLAAQRVETVRTQSSTLLQDPSSKSISAGLEFNTWACSIALLKSLLAIQNAEILRLRASVDEMAKWAEAVETVVPPSQLTEKLRLRVGLWLKDWEDQSQRIAPLVAPPAPEADRAKKGGKNAPFRRAQATSN